MTNCTNKKNNEVLRIGVEPMNPPFEFLNTETNELTGFYIDLYALIAKNLNLKIEYHQMTGANILVALNNKIIDLIACGINEERKKQYDFSKSIGYEYFALVFNKNHPISDKEFLSNNNDVKKKISVKLGSAMETWCKNNISHDLIITDDNIQAIEELKSGHADGALVAKMQAKHFAEENQNLYINIIEASKFDLGFMVKKGNKELLDKINFAIDELNKTGELQKLVESYFGEEAVIK